MTIVLPYNKEVETAQGAFVKPDGQILFTSIGGNERAAIDYCEGPEANDIRAMMMYENRYINDEIKKHIFECFKCKHPEFKGKIKDLNEYLTTKLTAEQLELYKKWLFEGNNRMYNTTAEFMLQVLGFDMISYYRLKYIKTTEPRCYSKYFNYALMEWAISWVDKKYWNPQKKVFDYSEPENILDMWEEDKKVQEEIFTLQREIPLEERYKYFR